MQDYNWIYQSLSFKRQKGLQHRKEVFLQFGVSQFRRRQASTNTESEYTDRTKTTPWPKNETKLTDPRLTESSYKVLNINLAELNIFDTYTASYYFFWPSNSVSSIA